MIINLNEALRVRGLDHRGWGLESHRASSRRKRNSDLPRHGNPSWRVAGHHGRIEDALRQVSRLAPALRVDRRAFGTKIDQAITQLATAIGHEGADLTTDLRLRRLDPGCLVVDADDNPAIVISRALDGVGPSWASTS